MRTDHINFGDIGSGPFPDAPTGEQIDVISDNQIAAQIVLRNWCRVAAQGLPLAEVAGLLEDEVGRVRSGNLS